MFDYQNPLTDPSLTTAYKIFIVIMGLAGFVFMCTMGELWNRYKNYKDLYDKHKKTSEK